MTEIKQEVQEFYDQVGWQLVSEDVYQNARYEDLRPVSREYIHRCHMRVAQQLKPQGDYILDAGSGPVQYPEYLEYSNGYRYRLCADISITALKEARKRVGDSGLYVVADIATLPFKSEAFDGVICLHTIHHLPEEEHLQAYRELFRVLISNRTAVVVNSWPESKLLEFFDPIVRVSQRIRYLYYRMVIKRSFHTNGNSTPNDGLQENNSSDHEDSPKGTHTSRHDVNWINNEVGSFMPVEILVWRSVSVRFLRALIHPWLGGRTWLRLLFWLEERIPHYFGKNGKYPLIVMRKGEEASIK